MPLIDVKVPDIGDFKDVEVIEVLVKPGDTVKVDQSLLTVESDKASMEIPSTHAGVVKELKVKLGDKVSEGSVVLSLEAGEAAASNSGSAPSSGSVRGDEVSKPPHSLSEPFDTSGRTGGVDLSGASTSSARTESGAARTESGAARTESGAGDAGPSTGSGRTESGGSARTVPTAALPPQAPPAPIGQLPHASPSIRKLARELGVPLDEVKGSGPKGRITEDDIQAFVKAVMAGEQRTRAQGASPAPAAASGGLPALLPWPQVDFAKFGPVERQPLSRIKKIAGANLHRNWVTIPHVTNHDDADITELEVFRVQLNKEHEKAGIKVTLLAFLIKAAVAALKKFPEFNASLEGDALVLKRYFHIGFAADTPNGLVVPVLKDADQKGILQIAQETAALAAKARDGKLSPAEMTGGCFSISSLGGIGGRYFTPIINAPEVAILGVCKSQTQPVWDGSAFQPRLILPLSLSWDHRVIDGAAAARFNAHLAQLLADFRRVLL